MKLFLLCFILTTQMMLAENIFHAKTKQPNIVQLKNQIGHELENLLHQVTQTMCDLSKSVEIMVQRAKELSGEHAGLLATSDKDVLKAYHAQIHNLQKSLQEVQLQLSAV